MPHLPVASPYRSAACAAAPRSARRGVLLPVVLLGLLAMGVASAGAAWAAQGLAAAERSAAVADAQWLTADRLLAEWDCGEARPGTVETHRVATGTGEATVRVRHAEGACWVTVAMGDSVPIVGAFLMVEASGVTQEANASLLTLRAPEPVAAFGLAASEPAQAPVRGLAVGSGLAWRDLR
ncbi:MAG: hypothetical protein ACK6CY_10475 [Gemmatimonadota bacterium]|jgi:hypothetical protein|nr:hypothetical protein [Gemmatimonadota bacterium]